MPKQYVERIERRFDFPQEPGKMRLRVNGDDPLFKPLLTFMPFKMIIKPVFGEHNIIPKDQHAEGIFSYSDDEPNFVMLEQQLEGEFVQDTATPDEEIASEALYEVVAIDTDHNQLVETVSSMENFTFEVTSESVTTKEQKNKWEKMKLPAILAELGPEYILTSVRAEFKVANPTAGSDLDAWIKRSIIDYGWRLGQTPPDITQTSIVNTGVAPPIIETADPNLAYKMAVQKQYGIELKEFQSYYWKDKVTGKTELRSIYYGSEAAKYNKRHLDQTQTAELVEDLYLASGDIALYNLAIADKHTGEPFVALVASAQSILFYDKPGEKRDGKLGPTTMQALADWKATYGKGDPYIQRMARMYATLKLANDKAKEKYEAEQEAKNQRYLKEENFKSDAFSTLLADEKLVQKFEREQYFGPEKLPYTTDDAIITKLLADHPRSVKDGPESKPTYTTVMTGEYGETLYPLTYSDEGLVLSAYENLKDEKQAPVNANVFSEQEETPSPFTIKVERLVEQVQLANAMLPQGEEQQSSITGSFKTLNDSDIYKSWRTLCIAIAESNVEGMGTEGQNHAPELSVHVQTLIVAMNNLYASQNKVSPFMSVVVPPGGYTYSMVYDIALAAGDQVVLFLRIAIGNEKVAHDDPRTQALASYNSKQDERSRHKEVLYNAHGVVNRVPAVFQTSELVEEEENFNPAEGRATPTIYPMQIYIEKRGPEEYELHVILAAESTNRNLHVEGTSLQNCMYELSQNHQNQLPDGTIYYYDPYASSDFAKTFQWSQRIEGYVTASEVFGYIAIGLVVVAAAVAAIPTGGSSVAVGGIAISSISAVFLASASIAGIASSVCYMYERSQTGQLTGTDIGLESANIIANLLPGINALAKLGTFAKLSSNLVKFNALAKTTQFIKFSAAVNLGVMAAEGIHLYQNVIDSLAEIDAMGPEVSDPQKAEYRRRILLNAFLIGALFIVGAKSDVSDIIKPKVHVDDLGKEFTVHIENGVMFRKFVDGTEMVKMNPTEIKKFAPHMHTESVNPEQTGQRNFTVHSDGKGNYVKRFEDTGEEVPINKVEFDAEGGIEPGRYEYSSYVEEGETKYRKKDLDTNETSVIDEVEFNNAKKKYVPASRKPFGLNMTLEEIKTKFGEDGVSLVTQTDTKFKEMSSLEFESTGPVLSGIIDTKSKKVFYGTNVDAIPEDLHPFLKDRVDVHNKVNNTADLGVDQLTIDRGGDPGTHSEIIALDKLIKERESTTGVKFTNDQLTELILYNRSFKVEGGVPPRCIHCWHITDGVEVIGND